MSRIVYFSLGAAGTNGGTKMIFRHVEALVELGYEAVVLADKAEHAPKWFAHEAPMVVGVGELRDDDIVVVPEDAFGILRFLLRRGSRVVLFCQNHHYCIRGVGRLNPQELEGLIDFLAPSGTVADWLRWRFPHATVEVVPGFADERIFQAGEKRPLIVHIPRKRLLQASFIKDAFRFAHPTHAATPWISVDQASERLVAKAMADAGVFLSLSRLEGLGLTPLEAMASGCVVAGFTGGGGREYATDDNGFWVEEDDTMAAVDALAAAADLVAAGGSKLAAIVEAGRETARRWSRAALLEALDAYWRPRVSSRP